MSSFRMYHFGLAALLLLTLRCGGGGSQSPDSGSHTPKALASVLLVSGDNQIGPVGTELTNPLVAKLVDSTGFVVSNVTVNFVVTAGDGSVFAPAVSSDSNGLVAERWTLGIAIGPQKLEIRAVDSTGHATVYATFSATAVAGPPTYVSIDDGYGQSALTGQSLANPVVARVADQYQNPVQGVTVNFSADSGGTTSPGSALTNSAGCASTSWTLGSTAGAQSLQAAITGISVAICDATALTWANFPTSLTKISGDMQSVLQHTAPALPLQVLVRS